MRISTRLLLGTALTLVALTAPRAATAGLSATIAMIATTATTVSSHSFVAGAVANTLEQPLKETQPQTEKNPLGRTGNETDDKPSAQKAKDPAKAAAEFTKLDAATLPIIQKIPIGGDTVWLGFGFGSVWVTVAKNNEVVRVDLVRNVVQARIKV